MSQVYTLQLYSFNINFNNIVWASQVTPGLPLSSDNIRMTVRGSISPEELAFSMSVLAPSPV